MAAHWEMVDAALVSAAHAKGVRVFGWTANEVHMVDPLIRVGVLAIITDKARAARAVAALHRLSVCCAQQPTMVQERLTALRAVCD